MGLNRAPKPRKLALLYEVIELTFRSAISGSPRQANIIQFSAPEKLIQGAPALQLISKLPNTFDSPASWQKKLISWALP